MKQIMNFISFKKALFFLCIMGLAIIFVACGNEQDKQTQDQTVQPESVLLEGENVTLAMVEGTPVTQYELEKTIRKTISRKSISKLDKAAKRKILDSLIASRAISLKSEAQLTSREKAELDKEVQAFREQLLVKKYIAKNVAPEPVSHQMVKDYYEKHPEKFGAETVRAYEMISTSRKLKTKERDSLMKLIVKADENKAWDKWTQSIKTKGLPVVYKRGRVVEKLMDPKLVAVIKNLKEGKDSTLSFIEGRPYLVRITGEEKIPPRPLSEVSARIRKSLSPVQVKKAVKKVSTQVMASAEVVYSDEGELGK